MLYIVLFGSFRASFEANLEIKLSGTIRRLFAYLLLQRYRPQPREQLASVFWGDQSEERAHKCLNNALWRLRTALEQQGIRSADYLITSNTGEIGFNRDSQHWLDLILFEEKVHKLLSKPMKELDTTDEHEFETMQNLYRGDLLEGFYDDWVLYAREHFRKLYLDSLALYMRYYQQTGHPRPAIDKGLMILGLDPLREEIHREIMRLYLSTGQRTLAIRQYISCADMLERELGILPMAETQLLYKLCIEENVSTLKNEVNAYIKAEHAHISINTSPTDIKTVYNQIESLSFTLASAQEQLQHIKQQITKLHENKTGE